MLRMFDYKCVKCDEFRDKLVRDIIADAPQCPNGHGLMQKTISTPAFRFARGNGTDMGNTMAIPGYPLPGY
jgi:predicted nucleic acid-binding Zn ribbon protein